MRFFEKRNTAGPHPFVIQDFGNTRISRQSSPRRIATQIASRYLAGCFQQCLSTHLYILWMSQGANDKSPSQSSEQDREMVARALGGDQMAYNDLMEKYQGALSRHVQRMVRKQGEVDDLVQECFIKAFSALKSYSIDYAFSTWLYKIATNHTIDFLRKKRLATMSIDKSIQTKDGEVEFELPDSSYRPDRHIVEDERKMLIQAAIEQLPEKYHRVIVMRHQQEKSYDEIAQELDLPLGTVKAHIFRARALLYKYLRDKRHMM